MFNIRLVGKSVETQFRIIDSVVIIRLKELDIFFKGGIILFKRSVGSSAGMNPETLKREYGKYIVLWGGDVDTQHILPFRTPEEVRAEVIKRLFAFSSLHPQ